jgi:hypothetical protein
MTKVRNAGVLARRSRYDKPAFGTCSAGLTLVRCLSHYLLEGTTEGLNTRPRATPFYVEKRKPAGTVLLALPYPRDAFEIPFGRNDDRTGVFKSFAFHYFLIARGFANILKVRIVLHVLPLVVSLVNGFLEPQDS